MPIPTLDTPGQKLTRTLINLLISSVNSVLAALNDGGGLTETSWCRYSYDDDEIVGFGGGIGFTVTMVGSNTRFTFDEPFDSEHDYCAQVTPNALGASNGDHFIVQYATHVDYVFTTDGGGIITPDSGVVNLTVTRNRTL